jgi:hypothetical protein
MSARYALGAVAALAGLAALGRRGGANHASFTGHLQVEVHPIPNWMTVRDLMNVRDPIVMIRSPDGQEATINGWDLSSHHETFVKEWERDGRGNILKGEALRARLQRFADWVQYHPWPMPLWRGLRLLAASPPPGPVDSAENLGTHWTTHPGIAWRFAAGVHSAASRRGNFHPSIHGRIYRALLTNLDDVDWRQTMYLWARYTSREVGESWRPEVEEQVLVKNPAGLQDVHIQAFDPTGREQG